MNDSIVIIESISYVKIDDLEIYEVACLKCGGTGMYDAPTYIKDNKGRPYCLRCGGGKTEPTIGKRFTHDEAVKRSRAILRRRAIADLKRQAAAAEFIAHREARVNAFAAAYPAIHEMIVNNEDSGFLTAMQERVETGKEISENMLAAMQKIVDDKTAAPATAFAAEVGEKVQLTGTIVTRKPIESEFGYSVLVVIKVSDEITVKTFTSAKWVWEYVLDENDNETSEPVYGVGSEISFKGTVKANDTYRDQKSSLLTRVALVK